MIAQADTVGFRHAVTLIKADIRRRLVLDDRPVTWMNALRVAIRPGMVCILAYRINSVLHRGRLRPLTRILDDMQHLYTGIELHFGAEIGPGFVMDDRPGGGVSEHVTIGDNCTLLGSVTMSLNGDGIDLSKGRIVIGDHCVIGVGVRIIGAVTLAEGTQVKPNAVVLNSSTVPGAVLDGIPAFRKSVVDPAAMRHWNPLRSCMMAAAA